jgi:hypothetical protein
MMDDETRWQDAAIPADSQIGPTQPAAEKPGDTTDYDELETGIASIFAAMQATGDEGESADDEGDTDDDLSFEDEHTFQLLGELDRLWQRSSP